MKKTNLIRLMHKYFFLMFLLPVFQIGCEDSLKGNKKSVNEISDTSDKNKTVNRETTKEKENDFFSICKEGESWIGKLQGLNKNVKSKFYGFKSCRKDSLTYDLIFELKSGFQPGELDVRFEKAERSGYGDFNVYAFVIKTKSPDELDYDIHGDPNIYPSLTTAYKYENNTWKFMGDKLVANLSEYTGFQLSFLTRKYSFRSK